MKNKNCTLKDLLDLIRRNLSTDPSLSRKNIGRRMLRLSQTSDLLATSAGKTPETAVIRLLVDGEAEFLKHLHGNYLGITALSSHIRRRDMLLHYAQKLRLLQSDTGRSDWDAVLDAAGRNQGIVRSIVTYAKIQGLSAAEFTQTHIDEWREQRLQQEDITLATVDEAEKAFRRALRTGGLQMRFPMFNADKRTQHAYSLSIEKMEQPLKTDVVGIVEWARSEAEKGSLRIGESIRIQLEAICGYKVNIRHEKTPTSVSPLLTEKFLTSYVNWLHTVRRRTRASIRPLVSGLHTILLHYPRFAKKKISWWSNVLGQIDREPNSAAEQRREDRALPFAELLAAVERMRSARLSAKSLSQMDLAWMYHDETAFNLAVLHIFHPTLIRRCRVNDPGANVFNKKVKLDRPGLKLTPAAERVIKDNPRLWQFDFEAVWGVGAFGIIIEQVAPLLGEYVTKHRKILVEKLGDPGTLFFARSGRPLIKNTLNNLIGRITHKFAGRRVTADSLRISFTDYWLTKHKGDYFNLANILMISEESVQQRFNPDYKPSIHRGRSKR